MLRRYPKCPGNTMIAQSLVCLWSSARNIAYFPVLIVVVVLICKHYRTMISIHGSLLTVSLTVTSLPVGDVAIFPFALSRSKLGFMGDVHKRCFEHIESYRQDAFQLYHFKFGAVNFEMIGRCYWRGWLV